jgi:hypothetical protein
MLKFSQIVICKEQEIFVNENIESSRIFYSQNENLKITYLLDMCVSKLPRYSCSSSQKWWDSRTKLHVENDTAEHALTRAHWGGEGAVWA